MKYLLKAEWQNTDMIFPFHWSEGMDRLEWESPYKDSMDFLHMCLDNGWIDRYLTKYDSVVNQENGSVAFITCINNLEGLEASKAWYLEQNFEIIMSVTELPDD